MNSESRGPRAYMIKAKDETKHPHFADILAATGRLPRYW